MSPAARAQEAAGSALPAVESGQITRAYDKAFESYLAGNYQEAIDQWNRVLRLDPAQVTARNMIAEARQKLAGSASGQKSRFYALVARGRYGEALIKIEEMIGSDPSNPSFPALAARLKKVAAIADRKPSNSKAWNICALGVYHFVNEEENLPFAYDALRYAAELNPQEPRFGRLAALFEEEVPQMKLNDTKPAQMGVLDHKKDLALHYIYDSKFYLAVKELESALKLEPEDPVALKRLGSTYLQLKDYPRAREAWEKASKLTPDDEQLKDYIKALDEIPAAARQLKKTGKTRKAGAGKRKARTSAPEKQPGLQNE
jgi:tetratricopeptide (TPR) repeat protein